MPGGGVDPAAHAFATRMETDFPPSFCRLACSGARIPQIAHSMGPQLGDDSVALSVLGDRLTINSDAVRRGAAGQLDARLAMFGGAAADNRNYALIPAAIY